MFAAVVCPVCGLQARFAPVPDGQSTTTFDAGEFRSTCKTSGQSKKYECPELDKAVVVVARADAAPAAK
jgi:hypothetical protein